MQSLTQTRMQMQILKHWLSWHSSGVFQKKKGKLEWPEEFLCDELLFASTLNASTRKQKRTAPSTRVYHSNLQKNNIDNYLSNEGLLRLLALLNETTETYDFFIEKEEDELRNLIEFVDDIGDSFIKPDTIKNCIISATIKDDKYKNICVYINDVSKNIHGIKQLYNKIANREEYSKIKIKEMYANSKFMIFQEKNKNNFELITYKCNGVYGEQECETNFDEIRDLRDRSLLLSKNKASNVNKQNKNEFNYENNSSFNETATLKFKESARKITFFECDLEKFDWFQVIVSPCAWKSQEAVCLQFCRTTTSKRMNSFQIT